MRSFSVKKNFESVSRNTDMESHFLYPGTLFVGSIPYRVETILGSCVSVCLFDLNLAIGGINHFLLPTWNGQGMPSPKYGDIAMEKLLERLLLCGCRKEFLVAKVFGGADQHSISQNEDYQVGTRNISAAIKWLAKEHIPITAQSTGGTSGRKIVFFTKTNQVLQKILANQTQTPNGTH